ncbi:hypothetical protein DGM85_10025 [Xanthomonas phaseoli pv. phaseoli]|nr:hypothetical protein DGM85_10025 [Xanthomonas phaseoli pv. phaseoli]
MLVETLCTGQVGRSLPAHRRGALGGMDAATELTRTYLRRVLRWWAGKGPAENTKTLSARHPCRSQDTPCTQCNWSTTVLV